MFKVNLLPPSQKEKFFKIKGKFFILIFSILFLIVGGLVFFALIVLDQNLEFRIRALNQEIESQKTRNAELTNLEEGIQKLESRSHLVEELVSGQIAWLAILEELKKASPAGSLITSFSREGEKFKISGIAPSRKVVGALKDNLEASPYFYNVQFESSSLLSPDKASLKADFSLSFHLEKR